MFGGEHSSSYRVGVVPGIDWGESKNVTDNFDVRRCSLFPGTSSHDLAFEAQAGQRPDEELVSSSDVKTPAGNRLLVGRLPPAGP